MCRRKAILHHASVSLSFLIAQSNFLCSKLSIAINNAQIWKLIQFKSELESEINSKLKPNSSPSLGIYVVSDFSINGFALREVVLCLNSRNNAEQRNQKCVLYWQLFVLTTENVHGCEWNRSFFTALKAWQLKLLIAEILKEHEKYSPGMLAAASSNHERNAVTLTEYERGLNHVWLQISSIKGT